MSRAWLALGSNLDDPAAQVRSGLRALADSEDWRLALVSRLYCTPPWGEPEQPDFINAVAALDTNLEPAALLAGLQRIEDTHGRHRDGPRWGPRTLDLDLLLFDRQVIESDELSVPHPRMHQRAFVLLPLAELAPGLEIPGHGRVDALLEGLDCSGCRLAKLGWEPGR